MDILTESLLPMAQRRIIDRAANLITKHKREAFRAYVIDILRARRDPPEDTDVRHAAGAGICKFGRRI
jgi:hypothetical protein